MPQMELKKKSLKANNRKRERASSSGIVVVCQYLFTKAMAIHDPRGKRKILRAK